MKKLPLCPCILTCKCTETSWHTHDYLVLMKEFRSLEKIKMDYTGPDSWRCHTGVTKAHLEPMSIDDAPETLGICRLVVADSFKAEGGTLPRVRGMWRPARLAADGTLRQMLFPMRT